MVQFENIRFFVGCFKRNSLSEREESGLRRILAWGAYGGRNDLVWPEGLSRINEGAQDLSAFLTLRYCLRQWPADALTWGAELLTRHGRRQRVMEPHR